MVFGVRRFRGYTGLLSAGDDHGSPEKHNKLLPK